MTGSFERVKDRHTVMLLFFVVGRVEFGGVAVRLPRKRIRGYKTGMQIQLINRCL